ncbi:Polyphenol oxidase, central domain [Dillenia turbinata]|uniref:Polyphenol oxidase, central domain n=1 Tax=Dillenia turbinata TaxID=194707 RepID=A0AAN8VVM5_9MAGN
MSLIASFALSATFSYSHHIATTQPSASIAGRRVTAVSCELKDEENHVIDRRNVLLGLGGLYGAAATLGGQNKKAIGAPVHAPELSKCHLAEDSVTGERVFCCLPYNERDIVEFVPPPPYEPMRVRRPAHKLDPEYVAKFEEAVARMKALPPNDPWNFMQQATIHCAYCNGAYDQVGFHPPVSLQVHGSWLFLPFHRLYLYFYERILGKLIGDPNFALPYWNWDSPEGMRMPKIYLNPSSPLYNPMRNKSHYAALFDYKYAVGDPNPEPSREEHIITHNLHHLHRLFKESERSPKLFMGKPVVAGEEVPSNASGNLENLHNIVHSWTGTSEEPYYDMGDFFTAARDIVFFGHHANVDRLWDIYNGFRGHIPEFKQEDWFEASFIFYDENRQVVRCKVKDCLTPQQLRYSYHPENLPWLHARQHYFRLKGKKPIAGEPAPLPVPAAPPIYEFGPEPKPFVEPIQVIVPRPKVSRTKFEKEAATEILVIEGIEVPFGATARFDVYVAKFLDGHIGPDIGELAGSFVKIPHSKHKFHLLHHKSSLELGITSLLEDIEADPLDKVVVTILPRIGEVKIGGIHIELVKVDPEY